MTTSGELTRCFHCGGTDLEDQEVEEFVSTDRYSVWCKVSAKVCLRCGERYFRPQTVRDLAGASRFPDLASFRESLGAETHPGNTILEMREEERS